MPEQQSFFDGFINELTAASLQAQGNLSIIEFANRILFNNDPAFKLYPTQQAILKAFYNEPLTEEERSILDGWVEEGRSTWVQDRRYISLVMEAGRRASKCNASSAFITTTIGDISYAELHKRLSNKEKIGIYTYNLNQPIATKYITYDIKSEVNKYEEVFEVITQNGKTETTNSNHPYLVWRTDSLSPTWIELKDLEKGDYIATSKSLSLFGSRSYTKKYLTFAALLISTYIYDGYFKCIKNTDEVEKAVRSYLSVGGKDCDLSIKSFNIYYNNIKFLKEREKITKEFIGSLCKEDLHYFLSKIVFFSSQAKPEELPSLPSTSFSNYFYTNKYSLYISNCFSKFGVELNVNKNYLILQDNTSSDEFIDVFGWKYIANSNPRKYKAKGILHKYSNKASNILPPAAQRLFEHKTKKKVGTKEEAAQVALELNDSYLYDIATNDIVWSKVKSIESRGYQDTIALEVADTHVIGSNIITHNSTMASIICLKEFYDLIIMENPHKYYGMFAGSPIAILVMAQSQAQVKETIFAAIKGYAEKSNFFMALKSKGEIEILTEEIRCPSKNIAIYAKHTNSKSLVGYTLKCMLLDEVARFETVGEEGKNKAFEIWRNVAAGGAAFGTDFKKVAISSAWEPGDPIEKFYEQAKEDSSALGFKLTTFQVNLQLKKGVTPVIVSDYKQDYVKARLEYEGVRFSKFNSFIDLENLQKAAVGISAIDAQPTELNISSAAGERYYAGVDIIRMATNPDPSNFSFVHVDPALKKDSAALAIARPQQVGDMWKIQIDALLKWEPRTDNKGSKRIVS